MTAQIIPIATHPITRARAVVDYAELVARRLGMNAEMTAQLVADTLALSRATGCSAAWAIKCARRAAHKRARHPEPA